MCQRSRGEEVCQGDSCIKDSVVAPLPRSNAVPRSVGIKDEKVSREDENGSLDATGEKESVATPLRPFHCPLYVPNGAIVLGGISSFASADSVIAPWNS